MLRIRDVFPGSRILIFYPSRIPDPKTATKERVEKKIIVIPFLQPQISQNWKLFHFWIVEEKIWANFHRIIELLPNKLSPSSQKYGGRVALRHQQSICQLLRHQAPASPCIHFQAGQIKSGSPLWRDLTIGMELVLQSLFVLHVTWCEQLYSLADPATPFPPPALGLVYEGAIPGLNQGYLHTNYRTRASTVEDEHCRKEPFEQLVKSYSYHLHMSVQSVENSRDSVND